MYAIRSYYAQQSSPVTFQAAETKEQNPNEGGKCSSFWTGAHESGNRSGSTLIDVGSPHMERSSSDFEQEPRAQQQHAGNGHSAGELLGISRQIGADVGNIGGAGNAVEKRDTIKQETGGESYNFV